MNDEECNDCHILAERVEQIEKRVFERFDAVEQVRVEAKAALDAKLEVMNEFRGQISSERLSYVTWGALYTGLVALAVLIVMATGVIVAITRR